MEKKNTGFIVLVVILCLLVGGLGGYIICDKVINKDNDIDNNVVKDIRINTEKIMYMMLIILMIISILSLSEKMVMIKLLI